MNAFHKRYEIAAEKRRRYYALESQIARETVMRMFEAAYKEYYGKIPRITYSRGIFTVAGYGKFTRNKLRHRAEYLSAQLHKEEIETPEDVE